jgi:hypothetical protein
MNDFGILFVLLVLLVFILYKTILIADVGVGQAVRIDRFNGAEPVIAAATGPSVPIRAPFDEA